jgi:hypothetical protein
MALILSLQANLSEIVYSPIPDVIIEKLDSPNNIYDDEFMQKITSNQTWCWAEQEAFYHTFGVFFNLKDDFILADIYGGGRRIESSVKISSDQIFIDEYPEKSFRKLDRHELVLCGAKYSDTISFIIENASSSLDYKLLHLVADKLHDFDEMFIHSLIYDGKSGSSYLGEFGHDTSKFDVKVVEWELTP